MAGLLRCIYNANPNAQILYFDTNQIFCPACLHSLRQTEFVYINTSPDRPFDHVWQSMRGATSPQSICTNAYISTGEQLPVSLVQKYWYFWHSYCELLNYSNKVSFVCLCVSVCLLSDCEIEANILFALISIRNRKCCHEKKKCYILFCNLGKLF